MYRDQDLDARARRRRATGGSRVGLVEMVRRANAPMPAEHSVTFRVRDGSRCPDRHPGLCRRGRGVCHRRRPRIRRLALRDGLLVQDAHYSVAVGEDPARSCRARNLRLLRPPDDQRGPRGPADLDRGPAHGPVRLGAGHPLLRRPGKAGPALLPRRGRGVAHSRGGPGSLGRLPRLRRSLARGVPFRAGLLVAFDDGRSRPPRAGLARGHWPRHRPGRRRLPGRSARTPRCPGDHAPVLAHLVPAPSRPEWRHRDRSRVDRAGSGRQGERADRDRRLPRFRERARHRHARTRSETKSSCECGRTGPATSWA